MPCYYSLEIPIFLFFFCFLFFFFFFFAKLVFDAQRCVAKISRQDPLSSLTSPIVCCAILSCFLPVNTASLSLIPLSPRPIPHPRHLSPRPRDDVVEEPDLDLAPHLFPDSSPFTEVNGGRCRKPPPDFAPVAMQSLFVLGSLWFGIQRLQEAVFDARVVDIADMELMGSVGET